MTILKVVDASATRGVLSQVLRRRITDEELDNLPLVSRVDLVTGARALREMEASSCCDFFLGAPELSAIRFYSVDDDFGEFSNFALFSVRIGSKRWPTTEHYFQAQKFKDPKDQSTVHAAKTPMLAARLGRDRKRKLRRDWESVKDSVMKTAVEAKFRQHPDLRGLLVSTGERKLVEHTENDAYWGDGGDGSGSNRLGEILMQVRQLLDDET